MISGRSPVSVAILAAAALAAGTVTAAAAPAGQQSRQPGHSAPAAAAHGCLLGRQGAIRHVIYLQFDNTHLTRDNPRVPSDLQLMPNLLRFITGHGTMITHEHTPLIAHTANDIVTSVSGLYGSDQGIPVANTYRYYTPSGATDTAGSFAYWADPVVDYTTANSAPVGDHAPTMIGRGGRMAPAPWVPYTRAGCDFGTVASANTDLENTVPDVPLVFGQHSPEAKEARNPNLQNKAAADFEGLVIHCARRSAACGPAHGARPDVLPAEPGGYRGYQALYGSKFVQPVISPAGPVRNLDGAVIKDSSGDIGFPGYNGMIGTNALAYTLDMQTHGIPVTFTYLSDLHESWKTGTAFGPGEAGYVHQARLENAAFGTFFARLAAHGITRANTLFVVTSDEGDHFVGGPPAPAGCDGVRVACHYSRIGEVQGNLTGLLGRRGITTPFDVNADAAPVIYVHGQPARTRPEVRRLERALVGLRARDLAARRNATLTNYLADPVELRLLHLVTADPKRTPTLIMFGNPDFYLSGGPARCGKSCVSEPPAEAWNHGDIGAQINTTWLGLAGPGVAHLGVDNSLWSDHTSIQPTMLSLLGLRDDYAPDGRVLAEIFRPSALPAAVRARLAALLALGRVYTQLEAPVGTFGLATLRSSTRGLASASPGDRVYRRAEADLQRLGAERDALCSRMRAVLLGAAFAGRVPDRAIVRSMTRAGQRLLAEAAALAA